MVTCSILDEVMLGEIMPDLNVKDQGMLEEAFFEVARVLRFNPTLIEMSLEIGLES